MRMGHGILVFALISTLFVLPGCEKESERSSVTSFREIHTRDIKMRNPCVNGYAYCVRLKKCIRPFGLVKDGKIADMEKRFHETCSVEQMDVSER